MRLSVVVPLYNKAPWVRRALDSIRGQTFVDWECLVVNDGSTDGGEGVVAECADPRVRVINQTNGGPGSARNRGIAEARGELVAFLDADDEWMPDFLEASIGELDREGTASISSGYRLFPSGRDAADLWKKRRLCDGVYRLTPDTSPLFAVHLLAFLVPCTTVVRREVLLRNGGFFDRGRCVYGEDSFLWFKVLLNESVAVRLAPRVVIHTEASGLSGNLRGPRPIEPILQYPEELMAACPASLRDLCRRVLALRAMKTACMLGYWGRWRQGQELLGRFRPWSADQAMRGCGASLVASPLGSGLGRVWRLLRGA